jgi:hypothetical protein
MRMLQDTSTPRFTARCHPQEAAVVTPLAARLGPRAAVVANPTIRMGQAEIEES